MTALGSAASVLSIIDILARAGKTVMDLSYKWADADFTLLNLSAQMTALRVALSSINTWLRNSADETHHQLVMDIETSLQCCYLLATRIDGQIAGLPKLTDGSLATASKARLILRSSGIAELQDMIERQTSALTLLLTACNRYVDHGTACDWRLLMIRTVTHFPTNRNSSKPLECAKQSTARRRTRRPLS